VPGRRGVQGTQEKVVESRAAQSSCKVGRKKGGRKVQMEEWQDLLSHTVVWRRLVEEGRKTGANGIVAGRVPSSDGSPAKSGRKRWREEERSDGPRIVGEEEAKRFSHEKVRICPGAAHEKPY
jgi:hypothetical protein